VLVSRSTDFQCLEEMGLRKLNFWQKFKIFVISEGGNRVKTLLVLPPPHSHPFWRATNPKFFETPILTLTLTLGLARNPNA